MELYIWLRLTDLSVPFISYHRTNVILINQYYIVVSCASLLNLAKIDHLFAHLQWNLLVKIHYMGFISWMMSSAALRSYSILFVCSFDPSRWSWISLNTTSILTQCLFSPIKWLDLAIWWSKWWLKPCVIKKWWLSGWMLQSSNEYFFFLTLDGIRRYQSNADNAEQIKVFLPTLGSDWIQMDEGSYT